MGWCGDDCGFCGVGIRFVDFFVVGFVGAVF